MTSNSEQPNTDSFNLAEGGNTAPCGDKAVEMALAYYKAAFVRTRPEFVPATVRVLCMVRADLPFHRGVLMPGEHTAQCNQWGAVSAVASDGQPLGLRPGEFEVLTWKKNEGQA